VTATLTRAPAGRTGLHPLVVDDVRRLTDDSVAVTFQVPEELREVFDFAAGQSLTLRRVIDGIEHRWTYSICSPVGSRPRIGVREIPRGLFSSWLVHQVKPGDRIEVQPPSGSFRADPAAGGRHLCIAAGSGITPMLSIATSLLANPGAEVTLLYGNRTTTSVMFAEELADLKDAHHRRFDLVHVLSREPRDVELFTGRLDADRRRRLLTLLVPVRDLDHVWLCGPLGMLADARDVLTELGVPAERVHVELFYVDEPPPQLRHADRVVDGVTSDVTVVLDGRTTTMPMLRDRSILDSAQAIRSDLPFACKGGVCGTPRQGLRRRGRHGPQLRPRGRRGRPQLHAHLPDLPGQPRGHRRLRRLIPNQGVPMSEAFILEGVRTPIGRYGGALAGVRPDDLAALVVRSVVERAGIDPADIDEVVLGAANQAGEDNRNVARMATLLAGLPDTVPGFTVNRLCASGLTAITTARQMIAAGDAHVVVAGGVESMTRAPWVTEKPAHPWAKPGQSWDTSIGWRFTNPSFDADTTLSMPQTAERVAQRWNLAREELDAFALKSHQRALEAQKNGWFDSEIVAVGDVAQDEGPRADTTLERLAQLRPIHGPGSVITAGNSSSLNDGAAAVVLVSERYAEDRGLQPRARVVAGANTGVAPDIMGIGPVPATRKVLDRAAWSVEDLDVVELNEAFASQALACVRELGLDEEVVNTEGGAIALGHPLGCSGTRITVTLLNRLERLGARRGLATMCVGVGQGAALLLERP
jgi:acetyl-CoA acyltransferase